MTADQLVARGRQLEYITLVWNAAEAIIGVTAGLLAGSIALVGFGLDSVIEISSGAVLLWRLGAGRDAERRERISVLLVGLCFVLLTLYVLYEAIETLVAGGKPRESLVGIGLAIASLIAMPLLARAKRRVASGLNSGAMQADSRQTDICAYLSAILLGGLMLNALFGWWWADPVAALLMSPIIAREGVEALRGKTCACHVSCGTTCNTETQH